MEEEGIGRAAARLDGPGQAKMNTLADALTLYQRIHGLVETYALMVRQNKTAGSIMMNLRRQVPALAALLKGQFASISDLVTAVNMQMTRGASEQMRVRAMREGMAAIRAQLEVAIALTIAKHELKDDPDKKGEHG